MSGADKKTFSLQPKNFSGYFTVGEVDYPINFRVWSLEDLRLHIEVEPITQQLFVALMNYPSEPGSYVRNYLLRGVTPEGDTFESDSIHIDHLNSGSNITIRLSARKATVVVKITPPAKSPQLQFCLRGFKSFRNPIIETKLGKLRVGGSPKITSDDDASGFIALQAPDDAAPNDWSQKADEFLQFIHYGLCFGHGSRLQIPRTDLITADNWEATFYSGDGFGQNLAPIPFLNQGPFIEALVKRYESLAPFPDMLWTTIGWLHSDTTIDEVRLVTSMTALEAIVEHVIPDQMTTVIPKEDFAPIRDKLLETLSTNFVKSEERKIFEGSIKGLNRKTLSQKIQTLRNFYELSTDKFSDSDITAIIKLRNALVHKGTGIAETDIWRNIKFIRALITHIMMKEIGYSGGFDDYLPAKQTTDELVT